MPLVITGIGMDPLASLLSIPEKSAWPLFLVRAGLLLVVNMEMLMAAGVMLVQGLMVVIASNAAILRLKTRVQRRPTVPVFVVYREITIWNLYTNQNFNNFAVQPLIFFGMGAVIGTNYGAIRLTHLPPLMYAVFPVFSGIEFFFLVTLLPLGAKVFDKAVEFLRVAKGRARSGYGKKVTASLQPIGIRCGSCGMVNRSWTLTILDIIANYTITMLITF